MFFVNEFQDEEFTQQIIKIGGTTSDALRALLVIYDHHFNNSIEFLGARKLDVDFIKKTSFETRSQFSFKCSHSLYLRSIAKAFSYENWNSVKKINNEYKVLLSITVTPLKLLTLQLQQPERQMKFTNKEKRYVELNFPFMKGIFNCKN